MGNRLGLLLLMALIAAFALFMMLFDFSYVVNMPDCSNFCGEQQDNNSVIHDDSAWLQLTYSDDDDAQSDNDGISRNMTLKNPEGEFSNYSFISGGHFFMKLFSGITISDVTFIWNDLMILENTTEVKTINLYVNSPGGDAFSGLAIADLIALAKKRGFKVIGHANGIVASAAVPIFASCSERIAAEGTIFMIHEAELWKWPGRETASDIKSQNELMHLLRDRYINILVANSKLKKEKWCELESKTTWFSAQTAKEWGLVDRIE